MTKRHKWLLERAVIAAMDLEFPEAMMLMRYAGFRREACL
jgi:hypothetical protein